MEKSHKPLYLSLRRFCIESEVLHADAGSLVLSAAFVFGSDFSGFQGHFQGRPVLPAIVQLALVRFLAESGLKQSLYPVSYSRAKFRGIIQPDEKVKVRLELRKQETAWSGSFTMQNEGGKRISAGQCIFSTLKKGN